MNKLKNKTWYLLAVLFLTLVSAVQSAQAEPITWMPTKRLTKTAGDSYGPAIAVNGSNIYVVWMDTTENTSGIYFRKSNNRGNSWSKDMRLQDTIGLWSQHPAIAVNGSNIYVVWEDEAETPWNYEIYFRKSNNGGNSWSTTQRLTYTAGWSGCPSIAADDSNIYVAWHDVTPGDYEIYYKKSGNGGATWSEDRRLTYTADTEGASYSPVLAVNGSSIYVVWEGPTPGKFQSEIRFMKSDDGGDIWSTTKSFTSEGGSASPDIAVNGSNIYVVWGDWTPGHWVIYFNKSDDGGATWSTDINLTPDSVFNSGGPAITVNGSKIYLVWNYAIEVIPDTWTSDIYFSESDDGGATWSEKKNLSNNEGWSEAPAIKVDGSIVCVVWQDNTPGNYEIYFKKGNLQ